MSNWQEAITAYVAASEAENAYDRTVWRPAYHAAEHGGTRIPDDIDAECNRLTDARFAAEDKLIATPAPDMGAVIWKIEHARESSEGFEDWPPAWWAAVMADLYRLAA